MDQIEKTKRNIDYRVNKSIEKSQEDLIQVSIYIKQLNNFIDGKIELSDNRIYNIFQWLVNNFMLNFIYQLEENKVVLRRARKFKEKNTSRPYFEDIQKLSYIQKKDDEN